MTEALDEITGIIARSIDYPSVYMGGPSHNGVRCAERVVKSLVAEGFVIVPKETTTAADKIAEREAIYQNQIETGSRMIADLKDELIKYKLKTGFLRPLVRALGAAWEQAATGRVGVSAITCADQALEEARAAGLMDDTKND